MEPVKVAVTNQLCLLRNEQTKLALIIESKDLSLDL